MPHLPVRASALGVMSLLVLGMPLQSAERDGNRLRYLEEGNPYHVGRHFPLLVTPQWVGEEGVEAVVVLAIDDMRGHEKWEAFLRPILQRLKRIDGRAPVSIMTCDIDPRHPHLQKWLGEGLSLETHTIDHPCPILKRGDLAQAQSTYERCVDLLASVPGTKPVAFRTPCCDSLNTVSPRFFAEIFNRTTSRGSFLTMDSSVFTVLTPNDPALPRELVLDDAGQERFRKYLPQDRTFVNLVEDYPYPYVLGRLCWEMPCMTPSDWQASHLHGPKNPITVRDWKAAVDAVVRKQGVFNFVFHPHGWVSNEQMIEFIDHVVSQHGKKVKLLTFREAQDCLTRNVLAGHPLRVGNGQDNGVRLLDLNNDGFMDVVIGNSQARQSRVWSPRTHSWTVTDFPTELVHEKKDSTREEAGVHFGIVQANGYPSCLVRNERTAGGWHFDGSKWIEDPSLLAGLEWDGQPILTSRQGRDRGARLHDIDGDGRCELIVGNDRERAVFGWKAGTGWHRLPFTLPPGTAVVDSEGRDAGLRLVDVDEDGREDLLFSNDQAWSLHLFTSMQEGWSRQVLAGKGTGPRDLPAIVRKGGNNGTWLAARHLWVQNENTDLSRDLIDRRSFNEMLHNVEPRAKTPELSLASMQVRPGFQVELMTAEPLVEDPIAFSWGPDGKLWVVEMGDYPLGTDGKGRPGGRVKYLEDTDGDGRYDRATVFLDRLAFPTGVTPWRKGVLVTCAPDIFYAEDTDGDGKADLRKILFTGFGEGNQQHRLNGLAWGLDNWLYGANGDSGGHIRMLRTGKTADISGRDFRLRADEGILEPETGTTQYGRSRDDWGNWFGGNNSNPMWHYVLPDHYLRRNPHVTPPELRLAVSRTPGAAAVFPISRPFARFNDPGAANHFTSANSPIVYRDDLFGPALSASTFVSEPVHNLIHREVIHAEGFTFKSKRSDDERDREFLASSDNWFRPTMLRTGPDGALWVADMYRAVIEHPEWIPADWQKRLDLRAGHDQGRLYRVYPVGNRPRPIPRLDRLNGAGLVAALDSASGWQRDMAQQMLLWRQDQSVVPLLTEMAAHGKRPLARLHALCTLDGLQELEPGLLVRLLKDEHPGVRRHAVRLCERRLGRSAELGNALLSRLGDTDAQVKLQLACTLGEWHDSRAGRALARLLLEASSEPILKAAVLSSLGTRNFDAVLQGVVHGNEQDVPAGLLEELLGLASALKQNQALASLLLGLGSPEKGGFSTRQMTILAGLLDRLDQRGSSLQHLATGGDPQMKEAVGKLAALFAAARTTLRSSHASEAEQGAAVRLLGRGLTHRDEDLQLLGQLLSPQTRGELQKASISALGQLQSTQATELLLNGWKGYGPEGRGAALDLLLSRQESTRALLKALENKRVGVSEIDALRRQRLLQHPVAAVREEAKRILAGTISRDREKVIVEYREVLSLAGNAGRGKPLFVKNCASCHRLAEVGNPVGPDLASLASKPTEYLLQAILDPNRSVEARYVNYVVETKNGRSFTGVVVEETSTSITLLGPDGKRQAVLRSELEQLSSSGLSAMPEGLEKELRPQDLADIIAFLRHPGAGKESGKD